MLLTTLAAEALELFGKHLAIEVLVLLGKEALVGAGEDGGEFLQAQEAGIERVDETLDGAGEVVALELLAIVEHGALFGAGEDAFDIAAG